MDYVINLFQIMMRKTCHKKKYMPKDRTKNYNMSYEGKCFEQYFRITVTFRNIIKLNVVHKRMPCFGDNISLSFTSMCYFVKSFLLRIADVKS